MHRPKVLGKSIVVNGEKYFVRGVAYGAFAPDSKGHQFPEDPQLLQDFRLMQQAGINAILTYTVPPVSVLDRAEEFGIRAIINTPWMEYECFLEDRRTRERVRREVREMVASCRRHPAVLMYAVAKEIPPPIVRWYGARRMEAFLRELCQAAKDQDPEALVTYTNYPTTEYLDLGFVDVFTFNVYLHQRRQFSQYLAHLQHLAGELPFVLTEFGMCSLRHTREGQAQFLDWQIEEICNHGLAGAVVFGWTDPFYQDNVWVEDWGFGLVDKERRPKPSCHVVQRRFTTGVPFPPERTWPRISVVVAAHNAARTLDDTLQSLAMLHYPDYEVIVVDDGSTDGSADIARRYPFRLICTPNRGVSAARNAGLAAATGEIVAYIDSDARADRDWLRYVATTYLTEDVAGAGGPNLVPPEDNWVAKCVYRSPGGPTQVMFDDRYAEHIPGCNMTFRKSVLQSIGGFDPIFTAAGDDVDICWRLIESGCRIGFNPAAVVWHHRRSSVKGYWRQQVGYGLSECLLEKKHPNKFNPWGHTFWAGRIYGPYPFFRVFAKPVIYHGLWGSAGFQPMYDQGGRGVLAFLPRAMEWHFGLLAAVVFALFFPPAWSLAAIGLAYTALYCLICAGKAKLDVLQTGGEKSSRTQRWKWRAMIAWLHFLEPLARDWGRLKGGLAPWRSARMETQPGAPASRWWQRLQPFYRRVKYAYRGNMGLEKHAFLELLTKKLVRMGCAVGWNPDSDDWDLRTRRGTLGAAILALVVEHHGGIKRLARISAEIRPSNMVYWLQAVVGIAAFALGAAGAGLPAALLLLFFVAALWLAPIREANRLEAALQSAAEETVAELQGRYARQMLKKHIAHEQPDAADEETETLVAGA